VLGEGFLRRRAFREMGVGSWGGMVFGDSDLVIQSE
jgi:hypothetical protein